MPKAKNLRVCDESITKKQVDESVILNKGDVEETAEQSDIYRKPKSTKDLEPQIWHCLFSLNIRFSINPKPSNWQSYFPQPKNATRWPRSQPIGQPQMGTKDTKIWAPSGENAGGDGPQEEASQLDPVVFPQLGGSSKD